MSETREAIKAMLLEAYMLTLNDPDKQAWRIIELRNYINRTYPGAIKNATNGLTAQSNSLDTVIASTYKAHNGPLFDSSKKKQNLLADVADKIVITGETLNPTPIEPEPEIEVLRKQIKALGGKWHPKATVEILKKNLADLSK